MYFVLLVQIRTKLYINRCPFSAESDYLASDVLTIPLTPLFIKVPSELSVRSINPVLLSNGVENLFRCSKTGSYDIKYLGLFQTKLQTRRNFETYL